MRFFEFANIKWTYKLPIMFVSCALIATLAVGISSFIGGTDIVRQLSISKLHALQLTRHKAISDYLESIEQDMRFVAVSPMTHQALLEYTQAWLELGYQQTKTLQRLYIEENPNPAGAKDNLDFATDGSSYSAVHERFHPWFRQFLRERGYYDIFLFDLDGNLLYSVFKENDFATNLNSGAWKDTDLGNAFRAGRDIVKPGELAFFDFKPYRPSNDAPASFIGTAVFDDTGTKIGVLVYQMPIDRINGVMQSTVGLGETGESFIVGADNLMRSQSRFSEESTILSKRIDNEAVQSAIAGESGTAETVDEAGKDVLIAYSPLKFQQVDWAIITREAKAEIFAPIINLRDVTAIWSVATILVLGALGVLLSRGVAKPMTMLAQSMKVIADGDLSVEVVGNRRGDELGSMAQAVEVFKQNAISRIETEAAEASERDEREASANVRRDAMERLQQSLTVAAEAASAGNFGLRVDTAFDSDDLQAVAEAVNTLLVTVDDGLTKVGGVIGNLAKGVLTEKMQGSYSGAFLKLQGDVNGTVERLNELVTELQSTSFSMLGATREISDGATDLSTRAESQAASLEETAAAMEEIAATVKTNAENALQANGLATTTQGQAERGREVVAETVHAMTNIRESAAEISDIVSTIEAIAFQTNLLALNAAVEAARAGDAGKGFAVVASEVRTLAQRSGEAAKTIKVLIGKSTEHVAAGDRLVGATDSALTEILEGVRNVARTIEEIADASREQTTGVEEVSITVSQMDEMTQQNAAMADRSAAAARSLTEQSETLVELVRFFTTRDASGSGSGAEVMAERDQRAWERDAKAETRVTRMPPPAPRPAAAVNGTWGEF